MDDLQSDRKEDDDDDDDDNDEIIIIENPNPKPKPPLIVLCESDDDEEPEINRESKDIISLDDSLISPDIIDIVSEPEDVDQNDNSNVDNTICSNKSSCSSYIPSSTSCINPMPDYIPLELPDSCDSDSSSNNHAITALDKNKRLLKKWYEKFKTKNSRLSSHKSSYTCPECRAELSTVKMLDRHVQSRHPSSIHRYQHNNTNAELGSECHSNGNASQQRLKLNPLKSPIYTGSATCSSISNTSTCTLTKNDQEPSKIAALPSLVNRRTVVHQNDKVSTATNTTSGRSSTTDGINTICRPLTVVIYSPNSERGGNDRFVQISPLSSDRQNMKGNEARLVNGNGNKQSDVIELFDSPCRDPAAVIAIDEMTRRSESISTSPCSVGPPPFKRQRQDPLILLSDDDNNEQKATRKPAKNNKKDNKGKGIPIKKTFSCYMHGKTFATLKALLQHNKDKHKHKTSTSKLVKGKKRYSLRPRNDLNVRPFPSSSPPSMDKLKTMKHIVMIDIDNWQKIFDSDLTFSPSTFVWGFHGGSTSWRPPVSSSLLNNLRRMNCFYLHPKCGRSKDAADFALCVQAGKLDVLLPKEIIFTVLSGDRGFNELQNQLSLSKREVHIVNPHHKTIDTVLTILNSIADR